MKLPLQSVLGLLSPIQSVLAKVLPDFVARDLKDPAVRDLMITAADKALVSDQPLARLVPEETRRSLIAQVLDAVLGHSDVA